MEVQKVINKTKRQKKYNKVISFDNEIVTKDYAAELLLEIDGKYRNELDADIKKEKKHLKNKKKNAESVPTVSQKRKQPLPNNNLEDEALSSPKSKKVKRVIQTNELNGNSVSRENEDEKPSGGKKEKESIRSQKKKKHSKLLEEKKLQAEVSYQQRALNYLSKWKHSCSEWKFEKLRQIWLSDNLFDASKIPDEFWETAVQYFSGSKGQTRKAVLDKALSIVDREDMENTDEDYQKKLSRARDIIRHLEE